MSGWTLGKVQFPMAPRKIILKVPASIKKVPIVIEAPWLISMGPDTIQLGLEGEFFQKADRLATIYASFCQPIRKYAAQKQVIDEILLNDFVGSGKGWSASACSLFKNTGSEQIKNDNSVNVRFSDGAGAIYQEFDANRSYIDHNFISFWSKGDTAKTFKLTLYNEVWASKANGYRGYKAIPTSWSQFFNAISGEDYATAIPNTVGTPIGWDKIRTIAIEPSESVTSTDDYFFDQMVVGQGWKFDAPGVRYDGIYSIKDFTMDEEGGNIRSFRYKMTLMDKTEMYGTI